MNADWPAKAACLGMTTDRFFPERGSNARQQQSICRMCPVRAECFAANIDEAFGIWGGQSFEFRRYIPTSDTSSARAVRVAMWRFETSGSDEDRADLLALVDSCRADDFKASRAAA
jgi:Transcription factor WhiB